MVSKKLIKNSKFILVSVIVLVLIISLGILTSCGNKSSDSGDKDYEALNVTLESSELDQNGEPLIKREITIGELRKLKQYELDASYTRSTGLYEEFNMEGPYLVEVFETLGLNIDDYEGIGVQGSDGYYCLFTKEILDETPDLMLALKVDGKAKLTEDDAPVRLGVQGQLGPYWVKKVNKITLFKEIPQKNIQSVWVFQNLTKGITPYQYEYYGSKDNAIPIGQIFTRFDNVDSKAFFTMKSADGFKKNEAIGLVNSDYYLKTEGEDAPTNISPNIKLGMNVKNISWISTSSDAAFFPEGLEQYLDVKTIKGKSGVQLSEILFETGVEEVAGVNFDIIGTDGEKIVVDGKDLKNVILHINSKGAYEVVFDNALKYQDIANLMRVKISVDQIDSVKEESEEDKTEITEKKTAAIDNSKQQGQILTNPVEEVALTIRGNGVGMETEWSVDELKKMKSNYKEQAYSMVNNWPTKKFFAGKGVEIVHLLKEAGIKSNAQTIKLISRDGYYCVFTKDQLISNHYYYPNVKSGSETGAQKTPAILAWAVNEGGSDSLNAVEDGKLRFLIGQPGINTVNTDACVKDVTIIEVSTSANTRWSGPTPSLAQGKVVTGSLLELSHDYMDSIKIYYTTDGTTPTLSSNVYNPSTSYFQPELTKPLIIDRSMIVKTVVSGWGRADSQVSTFEYIVG